MRTVLAYVENDAGMGSDHASAAWAFDPDLWGRCGQGGTEQSALTELRRLLGGQVDLVVTERIEGDEQAFDRDRVPCTESERQATLSILAEIRPQIIALVRSCSDAELDWDDPSRLLPLWARWRTLRQMARHIANTESRYYLPCLGLPTREPDDSLVEELKLSAEYVRAVVATMPADRVVEDEYGTWTTVKVLRRLAWHERGELAAMQAMLAKARSTH